MITFLHGYDPNLNKINPWIPGEQTWSLATDRGFIFVIPYGRRNSDFVNIGEDDTMAVDRSREGALSRGPRPGFSSWALRWAVMAPMPLACISPTCGRRSR